MHQEVVVSMVLGKILTTVFLIIIIFPLLLIAEESEKIKEGIKLFEDQKNEEAKKFFKSFSKEYPDNGLAAEYLGRIYLKEDDYDNAIECFKKAVKIENTNSQYQLWLGRAYGTKAQRANVFKKISAAKNVKKEFKRAVELDPENIEARFGLLQYYAMAPGIMGGDKEKAKIQAAEIKKRDTVEGFSAYAIIYEIEKNYELAEKEYLACIKHNPKNYQMHYRLAYMYKKSEQIPKTFELLKSLIEQNPEDKDVYLHYASIALQTEKNINEAESYIKQYIEIEAPYQATAHYLLGKIYHQKEQKDLAKKEYETVLQIEPEHKDAKKALKDL